MNKLSQQISSTNNQISQLEKRISELEKGFYYFNKRIQEESNNRIELTKSQQLDNSNNSFQIQSLKEKIDLISKSTNDILNQFKSSITKDFSERTTQLKNIIEEKVTKIDTFDKKSQDNQIMHKSFENNLQTKLSTIESDILSSIKKISEDLNTNSAKIDFLEKKQIENYDFIKEQISNINEKIIFFQNEFNILYQFKDNSNENFAGMANDIMQQQEIINNFMNKISENLKKIEINSEKNNEMIDNEIKNLIKWKEDIYKNIEMINDKTIKEINNFCDDVSKDLKMNQSEINLLEKHMTDEQKNFGKFIQEKIGDFERNINKNVGYISEDVTILKKDVNNLQKNLEDFKDKTFEAVNDVEKYQNKKYDDLFKIMIKNNMIMPNFNYNNKILKNNNITIEKENKNLIINEQNYNIGISRDNENI
jgi:epidermal growth factor receptor substrate 15